VLNSNRVERDRGMAGIAVVVARDVPLILSLRGDAIVATETASSCLRMVHSNDRSERI
jgi:hypothetical protein